MTTELCIRCKVRPIHIKKRKLCKLCYQQVYKTIKKYQVTWPLDETEVNEDIKAAIKKTPEYKRYIKKQVENIVKNI